MKQILFIFMLIIAGCYFLDDDARSDVYLTQNKEHAGKVVFQDTPKGLYIVVDLKNLPVGAHGFHIHENPSCEEGIDEKGILQPALKAGGHYDPDKTNAHSGPKGKGHKGDLPFLTVLENGTAKTSFYMPNLTLKEVRDRAIVIHEGGDNYKDEPLALGGGGKRVACGIIR